MGNDVAPRVGLALDSVEGIVSARVGACGVERRGVGLLGAGDVAVGVVAGVYALQSVGAGGVRLLRLAVAGIVGVGNGLAGSRVDAAGRKGVRLPGAVAVLVVHVGGGLKGCALGVGDVAWAQGGVVGGGAGDAIGIGDLDGKIGAVVGDGDGPACGGDAHFAVEYIVAVTRA